MPTAEQINPGFSTADAEQPSIEYDNGKLTLTFVDWREKLIHVLFHEVVRFHWCEEANDTIEGEPYDGMCIVRQTDWMPPLSSDSYNHYRLNFNASGSRLDIVCESFEMEAQA